LRVIVIEPNQVLPVESVITVNPLTEEPPYGTDYTLEEEVSAGTPIYVGQQANTPTFDIGSQDSNSGWTGRHEGIEMEVTIETETTATTKSLTLFESPSTTTEQ